MAAGEYLITQTSEGTWMVRHDGRPLATFSEKKQVLRTAITLAHASGEAGQEASVTGVDACGLIYPIWTHGVDAFSTVED